MLCVMISGGKKPPFFLIEKYIKDGDILIGIDSGADYLYENNITPHYCLGDFDSIKNSPVSILETVKYPVDKDLSDTAISLEFCIKNNYEDIVLIGGSSNDRLDHFLSNLYDISRYRKNLLWITEYQIIHFITSKYSFSSYIGETISFFSTDLNTKIKHCEGLKWSLENLDFTKMQSLSNISISDKIDLDVSGCLFIIRQLKNEY